MGAPGPSEVIVNLGSGVREIVQTARKESAKLIADTGCVELTDRPTGNETKRYVGDSWIRFAAVDLVGREGAIDTTTRVVDESWRENMLQAEDDRLFAAGGGPAFHVVGRRIRHRRVIKAIGSVKRCVR